MHERLKKAIDQVVDLNALLRELSGASSPVRIRQSSGSSKAILSGMLASSFPGMMIVAPEEEQAGSWASDLQQMGIPNVHFFPATRRKPYDREGMADASTLVQRSEILSAIRQDRGFILCASAHAVSEKLTSPERFEQETILISKGQPMSPEALKATLLDQGYRSVTFVDEPGELAIRGGIFDIWSYGGDYPVRLEFFGDEIDTVREFDPDSQRSVAFLNDVRLLPNAGFHQGETQPIFDYLPPGTLLWVDQPEEVEHRIDAHHQAHENVFRELLEKEGLPTPLQTVMGLEEWRQRSPSFRTILTGALDSTGIEPSGARPWSLGSAPHPVFASSFTRLREYILQEQTAGRHVVILCDNASQRERFNELLEIDDIALDYTLEILSLHEGFVIPPSGGFAGLSVLTDHQIFNRFHRGKLKRKRVHGGISLKELRDLNIGDYVVHVDYGIGRFEGFKQITVREHLQEAAVVRYRDDSILYVNVTSLHKLQKYSGKEGEVPQITKLGSGEWQRKKEKTRSRLRDIARELIQLYAARKSQKAYAFKPDAVWQSEMEARFEYEETPDQLKAIEAVKTDMEMDRPMDRLVCGDVGFGKTEVAIRAAFKAVMDQKQVAVLVPTTILAEQHRKTFSRRMKDFPVRVEVISRFVPADKQKQVLNDLKDGKVDILVGTHRIVSKDVVFKDLGLLIIDEEQRFGVAVKEKLKRFRTTVDVLTLTATPIPRTLQFSLMGARDLSIIQTPPPNRQPVYTEIHSFNEELVREAIQQETDRGGQVFFIHNRIRDIEEMGEMIRSLLPNVRIRVAHGQMEADHLEKIIRDFYEHRFDVLLSTNIVENGIDIANANTMIIHNAQAFGLSELHQLRGRVGRSDRKAFCYLITPPVNELSPEARRRLMALEEFSDLGAGFHIAMRDLDIRGAGDLLGAEQSGFINDIGFDLYTKILNETVQDLKETEFRDLFESESSKRALAGQGDEENAEASGAEASGAAVGKAVQGPGPGPGPGPSEGAEGTEPSIGRISRQPGLAPGILPSGDTSVEFDQTAMLDHDYISDSIERINLYRKLAGIEHLESFDDWEQEVTDRFGPMPESARILLAASRIKWFAAQWAIRKVTYRAGKIWLLAPDADTKPGAWFYGQGLFQELVSGMQERDPAHPFQMSQKDDKLRLIADGFPTLASVDAYLAALHQRRGAWAHADAT